MIAPRKITPLALRDVTKAIEAVTGNALPSGTEIRSDTRLVDLGVDEDNIVDLIRKLEESLAIPMSFLADEAVTVGDLMDFANVRTSG